MHNNPPQESNYRWYILGLAAVTNALVVAMPIMCMSVLFEEISLDLGLTLTQVGLIWGISSLPGIVTSLFGGVIGDRFGPRRVLVWVSLLAGITGAMRGLSVSLPGLAFTVALFGFVSPMIPMNNIKIARSWFSQRQLGLANGVTSMGMAAGFMLGALISATVISPWLGGWRNTLFFYGGLSLLVSIAWIFARPEPDFSPDGMAASTGQTMLQMIRSVARIPNMWWLGLAIFGIGGAIQGVLGYLPLYLRTAGWTDGAADGALSFFHFISLVFVIPIALGSDRIGARKRLLLVMALMTAVGFGLLTMAQGALVLVAVGLAGMTRDGFMAVFITMTTESDGVGPLAGTAVGFVLIFMGIGNLIAPPIGNSLAEVSPGLPFLFWAALALVGLVGLFAAREGAAEVQPAQPAPAQATA